MTLAVLPEEIYLLLRDYLPSDDYFCLLNTSRALFGQVKRDYAYYSLNPVASLRFLKNERFRLKLLNKVKDPSAQIALNMPAAEFRANAKSPYLTVHKVRICHHTRPNVIVAGGKSTLTVPCLAHFSAFECKEFLTDLSNCLHLKALTCGVESDVFPELAKLTSLEELSLSIEDENLSELDCSVLKVPTKLTLECPALQHIFNLQNIQQLKLFKCNKLQQTQLGRFHGIRDLEINWCSQIKDISSLGKHYKLVLMLEDKIKLRGYHILHQIPIVHLRNCDIQDLSVLQYAREVWLSHCDEVTDVSPLSKVCKVHLEYCWQITDISCLSAVKELSIRTLPALAIPIVAMQNHCILSTLLQCNWDIAAQTSMFPAIHRLTANIQNNQKFLTSLKTSFPALQSLKLIRVLIDFSLEGLGQIPTVILSLCEELTSLKGLGNNRYVEISYCPKITDVSDLKTVPIVKIIHCHGVKNYKSLKDVPRLYTRK